MPLYGGKENIGRNIKELLTNGKKKRSKKQVVAAALDVARKSGAEIPKK